jgi:hypothetical protein
MTLKKTRNNIESFFSMEQELEPPNTGTNTTIGTTPLGEV